MNKKFQTILSAGFAFGICDMLATIGVLVGLSAKRSDIFYLANANGYQEANAIYRQAEVENLEEQLAKQQITPQQFNNKIENLKDLSVDSYMSSESVSQEVRQEYSVLKNSADVCRYASIGLLSTLLVDSCAIMGGLMYEVKKKGAPKNGIKTMEEPFVDF